MKELSGLGELPDKFIKHQGRNEGNSIRICGQQHPWCKVAKTVGMPSLGFALLIYGPLPQEGVNALN